MKKNAHWREWWWRLLSFVLGGLASPEGGKDLNVLPYYSLTRALLVHLVHRDGITCAAYVLLFVPPPGMVSNIPSLLPFRCLYLGKHSFAKMKTPDLTGVQRTLQSTMRTGTPNLPRPKRLWGLAESPPLRT